MSSLRKILAGLALAFVFAASPALAANCGTGGPTGVCYKRAGTGDWATVGTWSNTSGGASSGTVPASGDHIILDANSGDLNFSGGAVHPTIGSFDALNFTGSLNWTYHTTTVNGNDSTAPNGVTWRMPSNGTTGCGCDQFMPVVFTATSGTVTINANGNPSFWSVEYGSTGSSTATWNIGGNFTSVAGAGTVLTSGTLALNSYTYRSLNLSTENSNTRALNYGSGTYHIRDISGQPAFSANTTTGLTITLGTGNLWVDSGGLLYVGDAVDFPNITVKSSDGLSTEGRCVNISNGNTHSALSLTLEPQSCIGGATNAALNISGNLSAPCTSSLPCGLISTNHVAPFTLVVSGTNTASWTALRQITFAGGTAMTATNSFDLGGNVNATITAPSTGGGGGGAPCIGC
jgi:hypothetical protein